MTEIEKDSITFQSTIFRRALENIDKNKLACYYRSFPKGTCGVTCYLLCTYLAEKGYKDFSYVCGMDGEQSHAWLEKDGIIVDITGDQFLGGQPVYVGYRKGLYNRFSVNNHNVHDMIDSKGKRNCVLEGDMLWMYPRIIDYINNRYDSIV